MSTGSTASALARVLLVMVVVAALPASALASPEDDLAAAQRRANAAAEELADAREDLARADDAVSQLEGRVVGVERRLDAVRDQVRQLAIRLYVDGTSSLSRLLRMGDANQAVRAQQFGHVLAGTSTDSLRQYRVDRDDLRAELALLERKKDSRADAFESLKRRESEALQELDRLTRVVDQARVSERAQAQPAAAAQAGSGPASNESAATQRSRQAASAGVPAPPAPAAALADAPAPAAAAVPAPSPAAVSGGWICPVQGPHAFSDDYGAPRGGGFTHQGNDILAGRGTPVVASVDGVVTQGNGPVSGLAYFLDGDDGNQYFGAHLDSFAASGRVSAGTVIGAVGNTGDAAGGPPHLHFEIHPGGGGPINPYPTLRRYC